MAVELQSLRGGQATGNRVLTARGQRTRQRLIDAAKDVFEATPYAQTRITDITAGAGLSSGTFYTYFDSKEAIFREVADGVLTEMVEAGRLDTDDIESDPVGEIANATRRFYIVVLRNAGVARSMEQLAPNDPELGELRRRAAVAGIKQVHRWVTRLVESGVGNLADDPWTTAMVLNTISTRVVYDYLLPPEGVTDVEQMVGAVTHVCARAVGLEYLPDIAGARPGTGPNPPPVSASS